MNNSNQSKMVDIRIYDIKNQSCIKTMNLNEFFPKEPGLYLGTDKNNDEKFGTTGNLFQRVVELEKQGIKIETVQFIKIQDTNERTWNEIHQMLTNVPYHNIPEICQKLKIIKGKDIYFNPPEPTTGTTIQIRVPVFEYYIAIPKDNIKSHVRKHKPGVYELWDKLSDPRPLYIGSSIDVLDRLINHEISYNYVKVSQDYPEAYERIMAEYWLIFTKRPLKNNEPYYYLRQEN